MKTKYLLDTNVIVELLRGASDALISKLREIGVNSCAIADITLYELYCGIFESKNKNENFIRVNDALSGLEVIPAYESYLTAAEQKSKLYSIGKPIEDFDLLIGCTALHSQRVLLTGNVKHMSRIEGLKIESI